MLEHRTAQIPNTPAVIPGSMKYHRSPAPPHLTHTHSSLHQAKIFVTHSMINLLCTHGHAKPIPYLLGLRSPAVFLLFAAPALLVLVCLYACLLACLPYGHAMRDLTPATKYPSLAPASPHVQSII
ncbi:hypothetical protein ACMFMF_010536 [Clarireedia jacksonii]